MTPRLTVEAGRAVEKGKTDVNEHIQVSIHVGLLSNEPPDIAGLLFFKSSDDFNL